MSVIDLNPSAIAAKFAGPLLLGLAVSATGFGLGWTVRGWRADSQLASKDRRYEAFRNAVVDETAKQIRSAEIRGRAASAKLAKTEVAINTGAAANQKEIFDAQRRAAAAGHAPARFDAEWVRLYNASLQPAAHPAAGAPAAAPAGAVAPDEWDVQYVNAENGRRWALCRANLNALIDYETAPEPASGGAIPSVVTPSSTH
jgi:hypothetical protein